MRGAQGEADVLEKITKLLRVPMVNKTFWAESLC